MALMLPYFPSRSKEYQKIWWRINSKKPKYFKHQTYEDKLEYAKQYAKRPYVKERNKRSKARLAIINLLGAECVKCGFRDLRALQLDHINGGGNKDPKARRSSAYYHNLLRNPKETFLKFQILCANCNWIKRYENQESKHTFPYEVN